MTTWVSTHVRVGKRLEIPGDEEKDEDERVDRSVDQRDGSEGDR